MYYNSIELYTMYIIGTLLIYIQYCIIYLYIDI